MSTTFLNAADARCADALLATWPPPASSGPGHEELRLVLYECDIRARCFASVVCKDWRAVVLTEELQHIIVCHDRVLSRRSTPTSMLAFAERHLGDWTTHLSLRGMKHLCDHCLGEMLVSAARPGVQLPKLRVLDLSACDLGDSAMESVARHCPHVQELHLWAVDEVTDKGLAHLAGHGTGEGTGLPWLRVLDLRACGDEISGEGVAKVARSCPELCDLRLKGLRSADDGLLGVLATSCPMLTALDVSGGACTDEGMRALAAGCQKLEVLHVAGCKRIGDAGVAAVGVACPSLRLLDLQGCATVGDAAALALAQHAGKLETVSFQCCAMLSDDGFIPLIESCPNLSHVTLKVKLCRVTVEAIDAMCSAHRSRLTVLDYRHS